MLTEKQINDFITTHLKRIKNKKIRLVMREILLKKMNPKEFRKKYNFDSNHFSTYLKRGLVILKKPFSRSKLRTTLMKEHYNEIMNFELENDEFKKKK